MQGRVIESWSNRRLVAHELIQVQPGEESATSNNSANVLAFLSDGESLPGDLSDSNFTNPEFLDPVQVDELSPQSSAAAGD